MQDEQLPIAKVKKLLAYMSDLGLSPRQLLADAEVDAGYLLEGNQCQMPVREYSQLYKTCMQALEEQGQTVPWTAGIATRFFNVLCNCINTAGTLQEVLERAQDLSSLLDAQHDRIWFCCENNQVAIYYRSGWHQQGDFIRPRHYDSDEKFIIRVITSCLVVWHRFCSWLIGRAIEINEVSLACACDANYHDSVMTKFSCRHVVYDEAVSVIRFSRKYLDARVVHDKDAIHEYMNNAPYHLMVDNLQKTDTITAIKSLVGSRYKEGLPTFEEIAVLMNMSLSSLRRELSKEKITYQDIKDECRKNKAEELLKKSPLSIRDISKELGFLEPASFTRSFKNWTDLSPQQYRMHYRRQFN